MFEKPIDTKSDAWEWLVKMKKEYLKSEKFEMTGIMDVNSLIDGRKIGQIIFRKGE
jgi:hypothetical protein